MENKKTFDNESHNSEIIKSRVGGFGGSDASMFYRIGSNYRIGMNGLSALTQTDKKRIRVAKGIDEYTSFNPTAAMTRGHEFENWVEEHQKEILPLRTEKLQREVLLEKELAQNFRTFAHADFFDGYIVYELKCVSDEESAMENNMSQLQWYYMLGAKYVMLITHDSSKKFDVENVHRTTAYKSNFDIDMMTLGIKILDEYWDTVDLTLSDELTEDDLMPYERTEVDILYKYLNQIEVLEKEAEDKKKKLLHMMRENGVKSIKSDRYNIIYVPEGITAKFDNKKLLKDHPEIKKSDYTNKVKREDYLKITLK